MMNFCTLFDSNYISKGIALYLSIERHTKDFVLYVMAMDKKCRDMLTTIGFERMVVDCIEYITDPELAAAKANRSRAEFCWTCGSYTTDYFLHKYELPDITYLDSDLMFYTSPQVVFDELENKNVSVGLAPHFTQNPLFGRYCVQYVYFKSDENGCGCLRWWRSECLKWCYSKLEDGKYGDQKYLDFFADKFRNVYGIENRGVGIAYWNMNNYDYADNYLTYKNQKWPIVFFHYSGLIVSIEKDVLVFKHSMFLTSSIKRTFIEPYAELMKYVYIHYLNTPICGYRIQPQELGKYCIKVILFYLSKVLPVEWCIRQAMIIKYRGRKAPYSERCTDVL